jgi:hypothetical protein
MRGWPAAGLLALMHSGSLYDYVGLHNVHCVTCFCRFVGATGSMSCMLLERQQLKQLLQCVALCQRWNTCCRSVLHTTIVNSGVPVALVHCAEVTGSAAAWQPSGTLDFDCVARLGDSVPS